MTPPLGLGLVLAIGPVQTSTADRPLTPTEIVLYDRWQTWERRARQERVLREDAEARLEIVLSYVRGSTTALAETRNEAPVVAQEPRNEGWLWFGAGTGVGALLAVLALALGG
ncbi:MAG TPA: hypothetical protein VD948_02740 [Rhodothermales bacterium]|nr:hypothetical protein [Rhodothermales bacterium]